MSTSRPLSKRHIDGAGLAVCAALTALGYLLVVQPIARRQSLVTGLRQQLATVASESDTSRRVEGRLAAELADVAERLQDVPVQLEAADQLNRRLTRIMELATEAGVLVHESRAGAVEHGDRYDTIPLVVSGHGTYPACAAFLRRLHDTLPDVEVIGFDLNGKPNTPGAPSRFRFDLAWYAAPSIARQP